MKVELLIKRRIMLLIDYIIFLLKENKINIEEQNQIAY